MDARSIVRQYSAIALKVLRKSFAFLYKNQLHFSSTLLLDYNVLKLFWIWNHKNEGFHSIHSDLYSDIAGMYPGFLKMECGICQ
jgi:hypothetical protein